MTLRLLWLEYQEAVAANAHGLAYQYSQFCDLYGSWKGKLALSMRQTHHADEKAFIDLSGDQLIPRDQKSDVRFLVIAFKSADYCPLSPL